MDFIIENWAVIMAIAAVLAGCIVAVIRFIRSGKAAQIANIKEWLLYATAMAEKELGSGTGKLKLRYVYDMFVVKFPWLAKIVTFESFSNMVDEALESMNDLLDTNNDVYAYVNGQIQNGDNDEEE